MMLSLRYPPAIVTKSLRLTDTSRSLNGSVVCGLRGPRPRYPRVWKSKKRIGTISKAAKLVERIKGLSNVKEEVSDRMIAEGEERGREKAEEEGISHPSPIFRDIRRYYCDYCGICRSKKSLISAHIQSHHKEEIKDKENDCDDKTPRSYDCGECGASFKKPAYLKQHMQSHSPVGHGFS